MIGTADVPETVLFLILGLEALNFLLLLYVVAWTWRAGRAVIGKLLRRFNLRQGEGPSPLEQIKARIGGATGEVPQKGKSKADEIVGELAGRLGVTEDELYGLADQYLGGGGGEGGGALAGSTGQEQGRAGGVGGGPDPLAFILQKVAQGTLTRDDLAVGVPLILGLLRQGRGAVQGGASASPPTRDNW